MKKECEMFINWKAKDCTKATIKKYKGQMSLILNYMESEQMTTVLDWTPEKVSQFIRLNTDTRPETFTYNMYYFLRQMFHYFVEKGDLILNPVESLKKPKLNVFAVKESKKDFLLKVLSQKVNLEPIRELVFRLYTECDLSPKEIALLRVSDIDYGEGILSYKRKKRLIRLSDKVLQLLRQYVSQRSKQMPTHDYIFLNKEGGAFKYQTFNMWVKELSL
jgi:site-specific recombinase XerD